MCQTCSEAFVLPPSEVVPFSSHFTEEETETQRKEIACLGHTLRSVAGLGFELKVACPSRRTLRRAGLHGLATQTWWTRVLGCGFCAAGSPWGGPPLGTSRAPPAQTELPCSLMPQLQAPASRTQRPPHPTPAEKPISGPGEGPHATTWFGIVMGCHPGTGLALAGYVPRWWLGRGRGEGGQESQVSRARGT